jgi:hypothetical protein
MARNSEKIGRLPVNESTGIVLRKPAGPIAPGAVQAPGAIDFRMLILTLVRRSFQELFEFR